MIHIPIPSELRDKDLIGSRWIRRMGKHRGVVGTLVSFNDAGCKLKIQGRNQNQSHLGDVRFGSIQWPMLMNLYEPEGILKDMIITVDKNDFVVAVRKEGDAVELPPAWIADNDTGDTYEGIVEEEVVMPATQMRVCVGPWHRKAGKGTELPIDQFGINSRGPHAGQLSKTCKSCIEKRKAYNPVPPIKAAASVAVVNHVVAPVPEPLVIDPVVHVPGGRQWAVTIVKEVTIIVEADDFLDAGSKAGDGEIVKVERIK